MIHATRLWPVLALGIIVAILFGRAIVPGEVFYYRDIHLIWYAQMEAFVRAVAAGSFPLWDPLAGFGQPLLADPSAQILYPPTWLNLLMVPWTYYTVFVVTHVWMSGVGMYALARRWELSPCASFMAAGVWMAGGPLQSFVDLWHHFAGACWIPWVFLAACAALSAARPEPTLLCGLVLAGQILAGSADMSAMTVLAVGAYVAVHHVRWRQGLGVENRRVVGRAAAAALLAGGLTAALWLPALELVSRSARSELSSGVRTFWSLHPLGLLDFIFPAFWGRLSPPDAQYARELHTPLLASLYLGLPTLGLVAAALARLRRGSTFLLALAGVAAGIALGRHAPLYGWATALLPPLSVLRYPVKATILVGFAWALLAGTGFDSLSRPELRRRAALAASAALLAVALLAWGGVLLARHQPGWAQRLAQRVGGAALDASALAGAASRLGVSGALALGALTLAVSQERRAWAWAPAALALLALGDLAVFHRYLALSPRRIFERPPEVVPLLRADPGARIYAYDYESPGESARGVGIPYTLARLPRDLTPPQAEALGMQMALPYATGGRWKLRGSYEGDYRGLLPRPLAAMTALLKRVEGSPVYLKLLRMGAVSHVITLHAQGQDDLLPLATLPGLFRQPINVFRVPDPLARVYVIGAASILPEPQAWSRLAELDWDPARELILLEGGPLPAPRSFEGSARIREERSDRVVLDAELSDPGYVVLVDGFDPGWKATLDGAPAPILRANLVFRAVALPAGRHRVELRYRPDAVRTGLALSLATALTGCVGILVARHGRTARSRNARLGA